jgi:outer membrane protein with beta-barrel domain
MKGIYEQQWQDAFAGVSVQPSEGLWEKIASDLDSDRGRHIWVTILLIAASVTLAFAFPLTIGNSSFEIRDNLDYKVAQEAESDIEGLPAESDGDIAGIVSEEDREETNSGKMTFQAPKSETIARSNKEKLMADLSTAENKAGKTFSNKDVAVSSGFTANIGSGSEVSGYGMADFSLGTTLNLADINDHYFIPYYLPAKSVDRNLLASLNMGTGSLSANSGFGGLGLLNADAAEASFNNSTPINDERVENSGSTLYFATGVELPLGKRWSFLAGLGYLAQRADGTSNIVLEEGNISRPLSAYDPIGPGTIFLGESYSYSVTNSYINVPLTIKYPFVNRKIKFRGGIGISTDFMISHTVDSDAYGKANYKPATMDYNTVALSGLVNLDLSYSLNNDYSIALEAGLRKGFTAIDKNKGYYPSSFTVGLVLFYKIQ